MKLGPETRRQIGDNYEQIIFQLLKEFGWRTIDKNFDVDVPVERRISGLQGGDGAFLYFDPLLNYNIGVFVESKKCKDLNLFKKECSGWLRNIDDMIFTLDTQIFTLPFQERGNNAPTRVQEGLLSVWIDEFEHSQFRTISEREIIKFTEENRRNDFALVTIFSNTKLLQLQALLTQLYSLRGKQGLSGHCQFIYPSRGPAEAPNLMMLSSDYFFLRNLESDNHYQLVVFHLGETSKQQLKHFTASMIYTLGSLIPMAQALYTFIWDFSPSQRDKLSLWESLFKDEIESKYQLRKDFVVLEGFNPEYLNISK